MKIKIKKRELAMDIVLFVLSCINSNFIYVFLIAVFFKIREGSVGFLKINMLYLIRQVFYFPGLTVITSTQSNVKLALLALAAGYILINYLKKNNWCIPRYAGAIITFGFTALVSATIFGSYPVAAAVKVVSFTLVFLSTVLAVRSCMDWFDVESYIYDWLSIIVFVSFCLIPVESAYLRGSSGMLFRGIWNHPNDFGVVCTIYLAMLLVRSNGISLKNLINIIVVIILVFLSYSRGAMITVVGIIAVYFFCCKSISDKKLLIIMAGVVIVALFITPLGSTMVDFFIKGGGETTSNVGIGDIFYSRERMLDMGMERFISSPLFGRGLLISYTPGFISYSFAEDGIEPGNIFLELLAGTGLIGLIVFLNLINRFFRIAEGKKKMYTLTAILASISELSFFSVNNYAFLYYSLIAFSIISSVPNKMSRVFR